MHSYFLLTFISKHFIFTKTPSRNVSVSFRYVDGIRSFLFYDLQFFRRSIGGKSIGCLFNCYRVEKHLELERFVTNDSVGYLGQISSFIYRVIFCSARQVTTVYRKHK